MYFIIPAASFMWERERDGRERETERVLANEEGVEIQMKKGHLYPVLF